MSEKRIPAWIVISGLPLKLFHSAFHSDRYGARFFVWLLALSIMGSVHSVASPAFPLMMLWMFIAISSIAQILLRWLPRRRPLSMRYPRKPASLFASRILSYHKIVSFVGEPLGLLPFFWAIAPALKGSSVTGMLVIVACGFFYMPLNRFYIVNVAFLQLAKAAITSRFRIIVFRKFLDGLPGDEFDRFDREHKAIVLPALGAYGSLALIHNESIEAAMPGPNGDSEEILSQIEDAVRCTEQTWKDEVSSELRRADLAVFHWATPPTENMLWELREAQKYLPNSRLLFVASTSSWDLKDFVAREFSNVDRPHFISITGNFISYGKPFHEFMRLVKRL